MLQIEGFNIKRGRGDGASLHREMVSISTTITQSGSF
jgi:hypothetical protein